MKTLIVEDELTSRLLLQEFLKDIGTAHVAVDGREAVDAVRLALEEDEPYALICLDIMMPEMDGQEALRKIRECERAAGVPLEKEARIVMTTTMGDMKSVMTAYSNLCDGYLQKPIHKAAFLEEMRRLGFSG